MSSLTVQSEGIILSVGYEGREASELLSCLRDFGVTALVDVRLNAISRKAGLSKSALAAAAGDAGIDYVHLRALGNPRDNRDDFRSGLPSARKRFRAEMRKSAGRSALDEVVELVRDRVVAVLCYEADHDSCHRSCVLEEVSARLPELEVIRA